MNRHDEIVQKASHCLRAQLPNLVRLYLFGSLASGLDSQKSDLDLAFLCNGKISDQQCFDIQERIAQQINRNVDLVQLLNASTVFRYQILSTGTLLFCADEKKSNAFEAQVFAAYLRFSEERQPIIDDIKKRGRVT